MILVTGGAGYIGSHTVVELLRAGHEVVVVDNLCNSKASVIDRIGQIARRKPILVEADVRDRKALSRLFADRQFSAVIHFAGLKAVGESVAEPLRYYDNNVAGSLVLVEAMAIAGVKQLVFSSSATVYGDPETLPIREDAPLRTSNPYGQSKLIVENVLRDVATADTAWKIALLRYFNPVGAHPSGMIGEDPRGIPNNLLPYIAQVASGKRTHLSVFGDDYPTPDGTGVRDYIHVVDLARGHLRALSALPGIQGALAINLGTGRGFSVLEMAKAFEAASRRPVPFRTTGRRPGDIAECYADPSFAAQILGWQAELSVEEMCRDAWHWQQCAENRA
ncbi:MAG: UDP-glucose 4-epimerase GalE [Rhodocyclaceae bacterium]